MSTFKERLKYLRKKNKMQQSELAKKLGVTIDSVSRWERGNRKPEMNNIRGLAEIFHTTADYLLGISDDEKNYSYMNRKEEEILYALYGIANELDVSLWNMAEALKKVLEKEDPEGDKEFFFRDH